MSTEKGVGSTVTDDMPEPQAADWQELVENWDERAGRLCGWPEGYRPVFGEGVETLLARYAEMTKPENVK